MLIEFQLQVIWVEFFSKLYLGTPFFTMDAANLNKIANIRGKKRGNFEFFCLKYSSYIVENTDFFVRNLMSEI